MSSLEPYYAEVSCAGNTCHVGQALIDAIVSNPEAVLAEGTSLAFAVDRTGKVVGLELRGVERDNLAGQLGLREGDVVLRVDGLPLTREAELWTAAERAYRSEQVTVTVTVLRGEAVHERVFVRGGGDMVRNSDSAPQSPNLVRTACPMAALIHVDVDAC